jgi:hypothetical protein
VKSTDGGVRKNGKNNWNPPPTTENIMSAEIIEFPKIDDEIPYQLTSMYKYEKIMRYHYMDRKEITRFISLPREKQLEVVSHFMMMRYALWDEKVATVEVTEAEVDEAVESVRRLVEWDFGQEDESVVDDEDSNLEELRLEDLDD